MEVYQTEDKYVLGICGGKIYGLKSLPKAIISTNSPVPTKWWTVNTIKDKTFAKGEVWKIDTEFREFLCDEKKVMILQFNYHRTVPGYSSGKAEFFVTEEYAKEKIDALRKTRKIKEYSWDSDVPTWIEVHPKLYYRKA